VLSQLASYVQSASNGDKDLIRSAGMGVRADRSKPTPLDAPVIQRIVPGVKSGVVELAWLPLNTAKSYAIEHTPNLTGEDGWTNGADSTRKTGSVSDLV